MTRDKNFQTARRYESPTVASVSAAVERGFATSFFGEEGAAGDDLLDGGIYEL